MSIEYMKSHQRPPPPNTRLCICEHGIGDHTSKAYACGWPQCSCKEFTQRTNKGAIK